MSITLRHLIEVCGANREEFDSIARADSAEGVAGVDGAHELLTLDFDNISDSLQVHETANARYNILAEGRRRRNDIGIAARLDEAGRYLGHGLPVWVLKTIVSRRHYLPEPGVLADLGNLCGHRGF